MKRSGHEIQILIFLLKAYMIVKEKKGKQVEHTDIINTRSKKDNKREK